MIGLATRLALRAAALRERRLSIVLFHHVLSAPDALLVDEPDIARFSAQMRWLRASFNILPLRTAVEQLCAGTLPARALCITFDDGYRDNALNAVPVLRSLGLPATFFVTTRYINGGMMWNDRVVEAVRHWPGTQMELMDFGLGTVGLASGRQHALAQLLPQIKYRPYADREALADELLARSGAATTRMMMDENEIRSLVRAGMEVGGHTVSHPILCALETRAAADEIRTNKSDLEGIIGTPLSSFAYPNGQPQRDYDARHIAILRDSGYRCALSTSAGTAAQHTSLYQLPRFTPWDRSAAKYLARMLVNYFQAPSCVDETVSA